MNSCAAAAIPARTVSQQQYIYAASRSCTQERGRRRTVRSRSRVGKNGDLKQASQIVVVDMDVQCEAESVGVASFIERQLADVRWKEVWDKANNFARSYSYNASSQRERGGPEHRGPWPLKWEQPGIIILIILVYLFSYNSKSQITLAFVCNQLMVVMSSKFNDWTELKSRNIWIIISYHPYIYHLYM